MDKAHEIEKVTFSEARMLLRVDGKEYSLQLSEISALLAGASLEQRSNFEVSPSGYGIHWPDLDEDLSIDGLIGVKHSPHVAQSPPP